MRILLLTQYFTPEVTAASARLHAFAAGLAGRGHRVTVVCEVPNHPSGIVEEEFRGKARVRRELDGFEVDYVWVRPSPVKTTRNRLVWYGSYTLAATVQAALVKRPDVVLVSSPPLPAAVAAAAAALRHRVPLVLDIRDLWPEAAVAVGELTNPRVVGALERLERRLYRRAAAIVTVTEPFRASIESKLPPGDLKPVSVIPNGTTRMWLDAGAAEPRPRADLDMPDERFVLTYAGNVGLAQGLEAAVDAASTLGDGFQLQIVGDGPKREELEARAASLPDGRVRFRGLVPPEQAALLLRASDAILVSLGADPAFQMFVPSKLFDGCAVGRPVVLAVGGEARRLAEEAGAVLPVAPGDAGEIAAAVTRLRDDGGLRERLGSAGRAFAGEYLRERQVERLERVLAEAVERS